MFLVTDLQSFPIASRIKSSCHNKILHHSFPSSHAVFPLATSLLFSLLYAVATTAPVLADASLLLSPLGLSTFASAHPTPTTLSAVICTHMLHLLTPTNLDLDLGFNFTCLVSSDLAVWPGNPFLLPWQSLLLSWISLYCIVVAGVILCSLAVCLEDGWMDGWFVYWKKVASGEIYLL